MQTKNFNIVTYAFPNAYQIKYSEIVENYKL